MAGDELLDLRTVAASCFFIAEAGPDRHRRQHLGSAGDLIADDKDLP